MFNYFQSDASNSPYSIRLLLKIDGSDPRQEPVGGIHWHNLPVKLGLDRKFFPVKAGINSCLF